MIGVSKTFGGSSILSSPVLGKSEDTKSSLFFRIVEKKSLTEQDLQNFKIFL